MRLSVSRSARWSALALMLAAMTAAAADWREISVAGITGPAEVHFVDATDGWLLVNGQEAGADESLVARRTLDGGNTWADVRIPGFRDRSMGGPWLGRGPFGVHRMDPSTAWVGGASIVAHTSDGGATWRITSLWPAIVFTRRLLELAQAGTMNVHGLHFVSETEGLMLVSADAYTDGYAAGTAILETRDGGDTWEERAISAWPHPRSSAGVS